MNLNKHEKIILWIGFLAFIVRWSYLRFAYHYFPLRTLLVDWFVLMACVAFFFFIPKPKKYIILFYLLLIVLFLLLSFGSVSFDKFTWSEAKY